MHALEQITISVPTDIAACLRRSVIEDGYESEGQIVTEALRDRAILLRSDEAKSAWLRAAVKEGEESGPGIPAEEAYAEIEALIASYEIARLKPLQYSPRALRDLRSIADYIGKQVRREPSASSPNSRSRRVWQPNVP
ncbi:MAG: type toxin-antitoxin system ParD family antitoxin [Sphingomonas bacterium]|uniref:ribbon-helix-helix domain-containing protein n=1 Tax=Sphingomonas bacterium TaxID=1895847 RepID=UPI00261ADC9D|nr:hypothetical protein [Sphingomonas bacterium]MDB5694706.1 type toxin-antitoxin system ParD family antitoxin [Sphingomonas bacterium]